MNIWKYWEQTFEYITQLINYYLLYLNITLYRIWRFTNFNILLKKIIIVIQNVLTLLHDTNIYTNK